jgi:hypothetical protein
MPNLACLIRGHSWRTTHDAAGSATTCRRCGAIRHTHEVSASRGYFRSDPNFTVGTPAAPSRGADELDEEPAD